MMKATPCIFFSRGFCRNGTSCRFLHSVSATAEAQTLPFHHRQHFPDIVTNGNNDPPARKQHEFRVMSYNILADSYAQEHRRELYSNVPNFALAWARRKSMIVKEVEEWEPDVVCFQEVDHYSDLEDALQRHGYEGVYTKRTGGRPDGLATFWKVEMFNAIKKEQILFHELGLKDNVSQLVVLQFRKNSVRKSASFNDMSEPMEEDTHDINRPAAVEPSRSPQSHIRFNNEGEPIVQSAASALLNPRSDSPNSKKSSAPALVIANIHVLFNPKRGDIKLAQVRTMLERAYVLSTMYKNSLPVIVCGDFNSAAGSPLYNFVVEGELDLANVDRKTISGQVTSQGNKGWPGLRQHFVSALNYHERDGGRHGNRPHQVGIETRALADASGHPSPSTPKHLLTGQALLSSPESPWWESQIDRSGSMSSSTSSESSVNTKNKTARPWKLDELATVCGVDECVESQKATVVHPLHLRSAYNSTLGQEPHYSTVHDKYVGNVDYIFYTPTSSDEEDTAGQSNGFKLEACTVLQPPSLRTLHRGLPSDAWPSDHISLVANFTLQKK